MSNENQIKTIAIIGGGWAGLSAAIHLHDIGMRVTVFESAHTLGGRARRVWSPALQSTIDNGQHLLLGAYTETLSLMHRLGLRPEQQLQRCRLTLQSADGKFRLQAAPLPAPAHLLWAILTAHGLSWQNKWQMACLLQKLQRNHWQTPVGMTVMQWLQAHQQHCVLIEKIWRPLCIAAMNTPIEQACAQLFANVLRDSTGAAAWASDLLIPRTDLSDLWPDHLPKGITVKTGHTVREIHTSCHGVHLDRQTERFDAVIIATNTPAAARLLATCTTSGCEIPAATLAKPAPISDTRPFTQEPSTRLTTAQHAYLAQLRKFQFIPIATITLRLAAHWPLPFPMLQLQESPERAHYGQWLFERSRFVTASAERTASTPDTSSAFIDKQKTVLTVVISNAHALPNQDKQTLIRAIVAQIARQTRSERPMPPIEAADIIIEKRATFAATPDLQRPDNQTPWTGIWCAGDWTDTGYPGVLEGAVISGKRAAGNVATALAICTPNYP